MQFCEDKLTKFNALNLMSNFNMSSDSLPGYLDDMINQLKREIDSQKEKIEGQIEIQNLKKSEHEIRMKKKVDLDTNVRDLRTKKDTLASNLKILNENLINNRERRDQMKKDHDEKIMKCTESLQEEMEEYQKCRSKYLNQKRSNEAVLEMIYKFKAESAYKREKVLTMI